jgi:MFS family permease
MSQERSPAHLHVRFNAVVNILDGAFFGAALGFASFITVIPLFVSQLTDSAILIGLVPAIHAVGWQLPQVLTAQRIQRLRRFRPMALVMTVQERLPFFGLALVAWFLPELSARTALALVFALLIWQGLGGGYTATVWQSLIRKIIPASWRGGFLGAQSSAANLFASVTAVGAGQILDRLESPLDFTLCFLLAGTALALSFLFLASTREPEHTPAVATDEQPRLGQEMRRILACDPRFRRFVAIRMIYQLGLVAFSYYAVYTVRELGASAGLAGWLTGVLIFSEVLANPLLGLLGDRKGHPLVLLIGTLAALISALMAGWLTAIPVWFVIFALAGVAFVGGWVTTMVISLEFGTPADQATYLGLSNTLIAPATLAAPFLAGWCIAGYGYQSMFRVAAVVFAGAALLSLSLLRMQPALRPEAAATEPA